MAAKATKEYYLDISMADEGRILATKTILGYEAGVRGLSLGQTLLQLLNEAIDVETYPPEVRAQLDEIHEGARRRAIEKSLDVMRLAS